MLSVKADLRITSVSSKRYFGHTMTCHPMNSSASGMIQIMMVRASVIPVNNGMKMKTRTTVTRVVTAIVIIAMLEVVGAVMGVEIGDAENVVLSASVATKCFATIAIIHVTNVVRVYVRAITVLLHVWCAKNLSVVSVARGLVPIAGIRCAKTVQQHAGVVGMIIVTPVSTRNVKGVTRTYVKDVRQIAQNVIR